MNAVFRCDATEQTGLGHLSRCISLAEALRQSGVSCTFAGQFNDAAIGQISGAGCDWEGLTAPVNDAAAERKFAKLVAENCPDFVVLDSYRADEALLAHLNSLGCKTVLIDDFCALESYPCDALLNFTVGAGSLGYPTGPALILGPKYFLARRRLVEQRPMSIRRTRQGAARNLLVAIGGTDPKGIAARVIQLLHDAQIETCLRALAPESPQLTALISDFLPGSSILPRLPDLSEQLLWADAAITGGGLIKYESAFMGVPAAAIAQNEGQNGESQAFERAGLVFDLGLADEVGDEELLVALRRFISDDALRGAMMGHMRAAFPPDPTANAAEEILEVMRN